MEIHIEDWLKESAPNTKHWIEKIVGECAKRINFKDAKIGVYLASKPKELEDINGIGGYCPSGSIIEITVDLNHPNFDFDSVKLALTHELYHLARRQSGIKIGEDTVLECLISEGLADHFVYETYGLTPTWVSELDKMEATKLLKKISPILDEKIDDEIYNDWFLRGSEKLGIAKWTGYSLGYALVTQILKRDKKLNSISFLDIPAKEITEITTLYDKY
jgi:uncharacterized protein YjaZ